MKKLQRDPILRKLQESTIQRVMLLHGTNYRKKKHTFRFKLNWNL